MKITLSEYAKRNRKNYASVYRKYKNGDFKTAEKQDQFVMIDEDERYNDKRLITGRYVGFRKKLKTHRKPQSDF